MLIRFRIKHPTGVARLELATGRLTAVSSAIELHAIDSRRDPDQVHLESSFASPGHNRGGALHFLRLSFNFQGASGEASSTTLLV